MNNNLLVLIFILSSPFFVFAQNDDFEEVTRQVHNHYYQLNNNIESYEKVILSDSITAYFKNNFPEKIVLESADTTVTEFYFNGDQGRLTFVFSIKNGEENRYYFTGYEIEESIFPVLYKWIDKKKTTLRIHDQHFEWTGIQVVQKAIQIHAIAMDRNQNSAIYKMVFIIDNYVTSVDKQNLQVESKSILDSLKNNQSLYCWDSLAYYHTDIGNLLREKFTKGCSMEFMVANYVIGNNYFIENGDLVYTVATTHTQYYGDIGMSSFTSPNLFFSEITYYKDGKVICKKHLGGANENLFKIKIECF